MLRSLSYRIKIPLAITTVIVLTEVVVTATLLWIAFSDARADLETSARNLTAVLSRSLRDPLVRDDLWQAYEVIRTPLAARDPDNALQDIVVIDGRGQVFVASDPIRFPVATPAAGLSAALLAVAPQSGELKSFQFKFPSDGAEAVAAAGAILAEDGTHLGTVMLEIDAGRFYDRLQTTLGKLALITLPGVLLLVSLGWWWGKRIAAPLTRLTRAVERIGGEDLGHIAATLPAESTDEIGQLSSRFRLMLMDLARKEELEREMVKSERLAAVGRVSVAIAHEINNPLGGMLNSVDTLAKHATPDFLTRKTVGLLQRGLQQIASTVSALLVEARLDSPAMARADWQDLRTLVSPQLEAKRITLEWRVRTTEASPLPAHQVRQLVLNLLLNAIKASPEDGTVSLNVSEAAHSMDIEVINAGDPLPTETLEHLFEPFTSSTERDGKRSHGIGLWVCYQIVTRLGGTIAVERRSGMTHFDVKLPLIAITRRDAEAA